MTSLTLPAPVPTIKHGWAVYPLHYKHLLSDRVWDEVVSLIVREYGHRGVNLPLANRCLDQALAFLLLAATSDEDLLALEGTGGLEEGDLENLGVYDVADLPDCGWHSFLLHSVPYFEFCYRYNRGRYLHHDPRNDAAQSATRSGRNRAARTVRLMKALGLHVDEMLWETDGTCDVTSRTTACFTVVGVPQPVTA